MRKKYLILHVKCINLPWSVNCSSQSANFYKELPSWEEAQHSVNLRLIRIRTCSQNMSVVLHNSSHTWTSSIMKIWIQEIRTQQLSEQNLRSSNHDTKPLWNAISKLRCIHSNRILFLQDVVLANSYSKLSFQRFVYISWKWNPNNRPNYMQCNWLPLPPKRNIRNQITPWNFHTR